MWRDPIVEEVRKTRERLAREWQETRDGLSAAQKSIFDQWAGRKVHYKQADTKSALNLQVAEGEEG